MAQEAHRNTVELSGWLRQVLDEFAKEVINRHGDLKQWRSRVLNPVLIRTWARTGHFVGEEIEKGLKTLQNRCKEDSDEVNWENIYSVHDPLAKIRCRGWLGFKTVYGSENGNLWSGTQVAMDTDLMF